MIKEWLDSLSEQQIEQHWDDHPDDDVALYCSNGLVVLDADSPESKEAIERLEAKHQLHSNLKVQTKKGERNSFPKLRVTWFNGGLCVCCSKSFRARLQAAIESAVLRLALTQRSYTSRSNTSFTVSGVAL